VRRRSLVALLAGLLSLLPVSPLRAEHPDPLARVRELYLAAVREESAIPRGLRAVEDLRTARGIRPGSADDAVLTAYRGALVTLRAKHAAWPPARLRHLREGLAVLDRVVAGHPDHPEVRYLRLMSCYYLPGILGRGGSVREDFAALARLLPGARDAYPRELYGAIVGFVLEEGKLAERDRRALQTALAASADE